MQLLPGAQYFNPRSPRGERLSGRCKSAREPIFQSTLPVRGATSGNFSPRLALSHFNPRSPCGERPLGRNPARQGLYFNPRSPCGERPSRGTNSPDSCNFNPRSPCGERLPMAPTLDIVPVFQSTLPVRGATIMLQHIKRVFAISIHAPRAGSDRPMRDTLRTFPHFNPRSPCGERPEPDIHVLGVGDISIHAPRAGSDTTSSSSSGIVTDFNPRSPCGERQMAKKTVLKRVLFQSTLPVRGATAHECRQHPKHAISIHAPRAGSDYTPSFIADPTMHFNPRSPCGERHLCLLCKSIITKFQSTLPVRGATPRCRQKSPPAGRFQSTLPVRGATRTGFCRR